MKKNSDTPWISFPENNASNEYLLALQSGLEFDKIFPTKAYSHTLFRPSNKPYYYWNDEFIEYYLDLSPYINIYAPEISLHMQKYGYIMDTVTREDKIFALYAGLPQVSHTALLVKNEILEEYDVHSINNFDELFELMELMSNEGEINDNKKVALSYYSPLMDYAMMKAGYYLAVEFGRSDIVCKINDNNCKPYLIEDTNILDMFFNEFSRFFDRSYFRKIDSLEFLYMENEVGICLLSDVFLWLNHIFNFADYKGEHPWNTYKLFLFDEDVPIVETVDSIQLIPVPYTCTQPEKAISFVNWLFTDDYIADLLTFGTDKGADPGYVLLPEGNIRYQENPTLYLFYNLIANFSNRLFPFGNKTPDVSGKYQALTEKAVYPPLYRYLESSHNDNYDNYLKVNMVYSALHDMKKRLDYVDGTLTLLFDDPSFITPDDMKKVPDEMTDTDEVLKYLQDFIVELFIISDL